MKPMRFSFPDQKIRIVGGATLAALALLSLSDVDAVAKDRPEACLTKPYVVKIHADWCRSCQLLEAVWEQIESDLGDRAIPVTLDVSDRISYEKSVAEANRLGISEFFQAYRKRTGTVAVLDCRTREPVAVMNAERDLKKYREAIARAGGAS